MVVKYDVAVQPVKLSCNACRRGSTYVVSYERRTSAEYVSHPQPCTREGEVTFGRITDDITVPSFVVNFETGKDKKLVTFAVYDFTRRPKVERILEFEIPLGEYCNAMAHESFCAVKQFPFRSGKYGGTLRVILRMFPVGSPVPTMVPTQPMSVVKGDAIQVMQQDKLIPSSVCELEGDADIIEELAAKCLLLQNAKKASQSVDPVVQAQYHRRAELEMLLSELEAAERADGGRAQLDSADRHMLELLEEEERLWHNAAAQLSTGDGSGTSPARSPTTARGTSPQGTPADLGLLQELELQKQQLQRHLEKLERQQSQRDVTNESIDALNALSHLEAVILETKNAHQASGGTKASSQPKRLVRFKDDDDDNTPAALARRLLHAHAQCEAAEYSIRLLETLKNMPYDGFSAAMAEHQATPVPRELQATLNNKRRGMSPRLQQPAVSSATQVNATRGRPADSLLSDLFASAPPTSSVQQNRTAPPTTSSLPVASNRGGPVQLDDLFGSASGAVQPQPTAKAAPPSPAPPVATPPAQASDQQGGGTLPKFDVLPIPTSSTPHKLMITQCVVVRCNAVRFADWSNTKFLRGTEVEFRNQGQQSVTLSDFSVHQDDIFSTSDTIIPCKANVSACGVPAGQVRTVYLSFGGQSSMTNGIMGVLQVTVTSEDGRGVKDSVRLTL